MKCKRCGNEEMRYFYNDAGVWYCRKCIAFGRLNVNEEGKKMQTQKRKHHTRYHLKYPLTQGQKQAVAQIRMYLAQGYDVLVYAACGAGKTELVMDSIMQYLNRGEKVGFAISRRQVVLEIAQRMKEAFPDLSVTAVCEGHHEQLDADLIVCTMHQLYRYPETFDLLIMDEIDAFPYRGNALLETIAHHACVGRCLYLTATPDEKSLERVKKGEWKLVELFQRPHGHALVVPQIIEGIRSYQYYYTYRFLKRHKQEKMQVLLFVPTIKQAKQYHLFLRMFFRCVVFTSKTKEKEKVIADFHAKQYDFLISTTILERGITIKGIHILVLHADHIVFNEASLIQIIGRVGRNIDMPTGEGVFLCKKANSDILRCQKAIIKMNESYQTKTQKLEEEHALL